jgi:hypothetical protein
MFEVCVSFIGLQPEIQIMLMTHVFHIPGINRIIRTEQAALTFSFSEIILSQHIALTYLLQPTTTIPPVQRIWKEFIERATRLTPTIAMAPFTCEL